MADLKNDITQYINTKNIDEFKELKLDKKTIVEKITKIHTDEKISEFNSKLADLFLDNLKSEAELLAHQELEAAEDKIENQCRIC